MKEIWFLSWKLNNNLRKFKDPFSPTLERELLWWWEQLHYNDHTCKYLSFHIIGNAVDIMTFSLFFTENETRMSI